MEINMVKFIQRKKKEHMWNFQNIMSQDHIKHNSFDTFKHDQIILAMSGCLFIVKC